VPGRPGAAGKGESAFAAQNLIAEKNRREA